MQLINLIVVLSTLSVVSAKVNMRQGWDKESHKLFKQKTFAELELKKANQKLEQLQGIKMKLESASVYWAFYVYDTPSSCMDEDQYGKQANFGYYGDDDSMECVPFRDSKYLKVVPNGDATTVFAATYTDSGCTTGESVLISTGTNIVTCTTTSGVGYSAYADENWTQEPSLYFVGDGDCDPYNNNAMANYDDGDCCEVDCNDNLYACGCSGYSCIDPNSADYAGVFAADGGNAVCNTGTNTAAKSWDGGDCCSDTCEDLGSTTCSTSDGNCKDPTSANNDGSVDVGLCTINLDSGDICFAGSETMLLENGSTIAMENVKIGDRVQVAAADGSLDFADVISLPHAKNSIVSSFVEIETATSSLKATPTHLVMTCDNAFVRAENVAVGACLATVAGEETVTAASTIQGQGVYSAVTSHADGIIVVNGFKASSFALNHNVANAYYNIHRALYAYAPYMVAGLSGLTAFLGKLAFGAYSA